MNPSDRLLAWLLTYAVHGTGLLGLAWVATRWIKSPATREIVWKVGLVGGLVTSLIQTLGVRPITARYQIAAAPISARHSTPTAPITARPSTSTAPTNRLIASGEAAGASTEAEVATSAPSTPTAALVAWIRRFDGSAVGTVAVALWLAGAVALVFSFARRRWHLSRHLGPRRPLVGHPMVAELAALRARFGVGREIVLTVSDRLPSPIAVGLSEICVPTVALRELDERERVGMLAHELAHLIRGDTVWLAVAALLERVFFFQPLNRLARRRIQADAELLCDEWAAGAMGSGLPVAKCLVKVAEWIDAAPRPIPLVGMAEERSELVDRVQRLVEEGPMSARPRWRTVFAGVAIMVAGTALIAPNVSLVGQRPAPTGGSGVVERSDRDDAEGRESAAPAAASQDTTGAVVAALAAALKDPNAGVRRAAASSLGRLEDRRAVPALIAAVNDDDAEVREAVTEALGGFEDLRAVDALRSRLDDPVAGVRKSALQGLSQFDREHAQAAWFRPWLTDGDAEARATAARALGELADRASVDALVTLLADPSGDVRQAAAAALGEIHDPSSVDALARAVGDANASVRQQALDALGEFELTVAPAQALAALTDAVPEIRASAAHLIGHIGDRRGVGALRGLLADPDEDVRAAAVEALSEIRDPAAIEALVAGLKSSDPVVRKAAAEALGQKQD